MEDGRVKEMEANGPYTCMATEEEQKHIVSLVRRIRRNRPLRKLAQRCLEGEAVASTVDFDMLKRVVLGLEFVTWRERTVAAWLLGLIPQDEEQRRNAARWLCKVLGGTHPESQNEAWKEHSQGTLRYIGVVLLILLACGLAGTIIHPLFIWIPIIVLFGIITLIPGMILFLLFVTCIGAVLWAPIAIISELHFEQIRAAAITALGRLRVPESVSILSRSAWDGSPRVSEAAKVALRKVIPTLTPNHYGALSADTTPNLARLLHEWDVLYEQDEDFAREVLAALEKVGDGRAVKSVERIAEEGPTEQLKQAAAAVLPILQERQQKEKDARLLLRAAQAPEDPSHILLRPAGGPPEADTQQLLRPASPKQ